MARKPDLTEFYKLSRPKKRPCQIGFAMEKLPEAEKLALETACKEDPGVITNAAVQQWLDARKYDVSIPVVVSHRKKNCTCYD